MKVNKEIEMKDSNFCEQHGKWESRLVEKCWVERGSRDHIGYLVMCAQAVGELKEKSWKVSQT